MTSDGIEYNLKITPFIFEVNYKGCIVFYHFSSKLHMKKFEKQQPKKLYKKYLLNMRFGVLEDIVKYSKIESRGFRVTTLDGTEIENINDVNFDFLITLKKKE